MAVDAKLQRLIDLAAPYWAGEGEVVRTYWSSPKRTRATDLLWLSRQCFKEFWGSGVGKYDKGGIFLGVLKNIVARADAIDVGFDRHEMLELLEGFKAEFTHYCAFADVYDVLRPAGAPRLNPKLLESWPDEDALTALRFRHQEQHGEIGLRACKLTEGGYCGLFREGMALADKGGVDAKIAAACALVYDDEFGHMLKGVVGLDDEALRPAEWQELADLSVAQLKLRIRMRNAQFGFPLSEARVQAIAAGACAPLAFDYAKAQLAA